MAHLELDLHWISLSLDEGTVLLQAAGFPDCSCVATGDKAAERALTRLIEGKLDQLSRHRHNHALPTGLEAQSVSIQMTAPLRQAEWRVPVSLTFDVLHYVDAAQRPHALVPALNLDIAANDELTLRESVTEQIQTLLRKVEPRARLRELARLEQRHGATMRRGRVALHVPSPRQLATRDVRGDAPSVLEEVSEPMPPMRAFELDADLLRLREALGGDSAHSVLLIGPAGCGKTTLVAELARTHALAGVEIRHASGASLVAGQSGFGQWQARVQALVRELSAGKAILHLGALTELMEVGRTRQGEQSIAGYLRADIARGAIRVISECTPEQLSAIERDEPGLIAAFRTLELQAPDRDRTRRILAREASAMRSAQSDVWIAWVERLHRRYAGYSAHPARCLRFLRECLQTHPQPTLADVTRLFARQTGLPEWLLDDAQHFDPETALARFEQQVMGQRDAVAALVARIGAIKADLHRAGRPLGSFLLIGPTGTGKTELAKTLAAYLFGHRNRLTRFDLSQATDPASVQKLIGSRAYGSPEGLLTARIREQPFSVLLLDEFEKAHPSFFDLLLQMLGDARLTDGSGRVADFSNCMILLTSNLGTADAQRRPVGFAATAKASTADFEDAVRRFLRPELLNRLDAILPFHALDATRIRSIAAREIDLALRRDGLRQRGIEITVDAAVVDALAASGYDARLGARPLKRAIEAELMVPIAEALCAEPMARRLIRSAEGRYRALAATPGAATAPLAHADAARRLRIDVQRLQHCQALQALRDESSLLRQRFKRANRGRAATSATPERMALVDALTLRVSRLLAAVTAAEDLALASVWDPRGEPATQTLKPLRDELGQCRLQLYRARLEHPDEAHVLVRSDHSIWLHELLHGCLLLAAGGQAQALQLIERKGEHTQIRPFDPKRDPSIYDQPNSALVGVVLAVHGALFFPLYARECGLHIFRPRDGSVRHGLLHLVDVPYALPPDWSAPLAERHVPRRRSFDEANGECQDGPDKAHRLPWDGLPARHLMARQARAALQLSIDAVDEDPA